MPKHVSHVSQDTGVAAVRTSAKVVKVTIVVNILDVIMAVKTDFTALKFLIKRFATNALKIVIHVIVTLLVRLAKQGIME